MLGKLIFIIKLLEGLFNILYGLFVVLGELLNAWRNFRNSFDNKEKEK